MNFRQKLVVYYILGNFGILLILDLNSVLREFILWDQRLYKGFFCENSEGLRYCYIIFFFLELCFKFSVNKY